jgi:hypothetical protein
MTCRRARRRPLIPNGSAFPTSLSSALSAIPAGTVADPEMLSLLALQKPSWPPRPPCGLCDRGALRTSNRMNDVVGGIDVRLRFEVTLTQDVGGGDFPQAKAEALKECPDVLGVNAERDRLAEERQ